MLYEGKLTENALAELAKYADLLDCECPNHLMDILAKVREFEAYTSSCIDKYPKDAATHKWLQKSAANLDSLLSNTIIQLARMEGFVDDDNNFVPRAKLQSGKDL